MLICGLRQELLRNALYKFDHLRETVLHLRHLLHLRIDDHHLLHQGRQQLDDASLQRLCSKLQA